jgi:hypothetical protein
MSDDTSSNLPIPTGPVIGQAGESVRPRKGRTTPPSPDDPVFSAQMLSGGEKRGLRGGPETLDRAKSTYLKSEYSGSNDRRPRPGRVTRTDI